MNYDVIVVGGGIVGASIAFYLTKTKGINVLLCEKGKPPGDGATSISGGLIRVHHTNKANQYLSFRSLQIYRELMKNSKMDFGYNPIGFSLIVSPEYVENLNNNVQYMNKLKLPTVIYSPQEYSLREKFINVENIGAISYEPLGGYGDPAKSSITFLNEALKQGLHLMEGTEVEKLLMKKDKVVGVKTNFANIYSKQVIIASNFWSKKLTKQLEFNIPLYTKRLGVVFAHTHNYNVLSHSYIDDTSDTYMRPFPDGRILIGIKSSDCNTNIDHLSKKIHYNEAEEALFRASKRFPVLSKAKLLGGRIGFDSYTPDQYPIIGQSEIEGLYLSIGFSGGGYKIAPAVGEFIAEEITENKKTNELKYYGLERFKGYNNTYFQTSNMYKYM
ncbi:MULTISPECIES: FAD-dependent oxidoreductase [Clostridia]|uniref:NAD(P)/FAD-dependent oxidoreductase n=1 Tax=Clostridia TaxID=186801 RepID=UPI000EA0C658|nr:MULTISPECIES: FAD-dependent oxidoreductase [Clostridia]NBJ69341.1 FAD-binding oxidoreductase [Roseburia sp. 1XD42-34]RKI79008.1 FAD-binding oxidoreductase [Clostridium sp. 1xD42-85]